MTTEKERIYEELIGELKQQVDEWQDLAERQAEEIINRRKELAKMFESVKSLKQIIEARTFDNQLLENRLSIKQSYIEILEDDLKQRVPSTKDVAALESRLDTALEMIEAMFDDREEWSETLEAAKKSLVEEKARGDFYFHLFDYWYNQTAQLAQKNRELEAAGKEWKQLSFNLDRFDVG